MTDDELQRLVRRPHRHIVAWNALMLCMVVALVYGLVVIRKPMAQLEQLDSFNRDFVTITCDTSLYSKDELARRTPEARRRLQLICVRRQLP